MAVDRRPNVLLILASGWRAQAVAWAPDSELATPNLAHLGRESVTFSRAYTTYPRPIPSRAGLLHGRFPSALNLEAPALGDVLNAEGYSVGRFGGRDVDEVVSFVHRSSPFYVEWTLDATPGLLERRAPDSVPLRGNVPPESRSRARTAISDFAARCWSQDRAIGIALAALDVPGLHENTVVAFTSDRGGQLGSHGQFRDDSPFEETVRVPLVIRYPNLLPRGREESILVSHMDLLPTILGLSRIPVPTSVQGQDLSSWILERRGERPEAVYAVGRTGQPDEWRMLVHGYDKLVTGSKGEVTHLFNLADDPGEMRNLAEGAADQLKRDSLLALQRVWTRKMEDRTDRSGLKTR